MAFEPQKFISATQDAMVTNIADVAEDQLIRVYVYEMSNQDRAGAVMVAPQALSTVAIQNVKNSSETSMSTLLEDENGDRYFEFLAEESEGGELKKVSKEDISEYKFVNVSRFVGITNQFRSNDGDAPKLFTIREPYNYEAYMKGDQAVYYASIDPTIVYDTEDLVDIIDAEKYLLNENHLLSIDLKDTQDWERQNANSKLIFLLGGYDLSNPRIDVDFGQYTEQQFKFADDSDIPMQNGIISLTISKDVNGSRRHVFANAYQDNIIRAYELQNISLSDINANDTDAQVAQKHKDDVETIRTYLENQFLNGLASGGVDFSDAKINDYYNIINKIWAGDALTINYDDSSANQTINESHGLYPLDSQNIDVVDMETIVYKTKVMTNGAISNTNGFTFNKKTHNYSSYGSSMYTAVIVGGKVEIHKNFNKDSEITPPSTPYHTGIWLTPNSEQLVAIDTGRNPGSQYNEYYFYLDGQPLYGGNIIQIAHNTNMGVYFYGGKTIIICGNGRGGTTVYVDGVESLTQHLDKIIHDVSLDYRFVGSSILNTDDLYMTVNDGDLVIYKNLAPWLYTKTSLTANNSPKMFEFYSHIYTIMDDVVFKDDDSTPVLHGSGSVIGFIQDTATHIYSVSGQQVYKDGVLVYTATNNILKGWTTNDGWYIFIKATNGSYQIIKDGILDIDLGTTMDIPYAAITLNDKYLLILTNGTDKYTVFANGGYIPSQEDGKMFETFETPILIIRPEDAANNIPVKYEIVGEDDLAGFKSDTYIQTKNLPGLKIKTNPTALMSRISAKANTAWGKTDLDFKIGGHVMPLMVRIAGVSDKVTIEVPWFDTSMVAPYFFVKDFFNTTTGATLSGILTEQEDRDLIYDLIGVTKAYTDKFKDFPIEPATPTQQSTGKTAANVSIGWRAALKAPLLIGQTALQVNDGLFKDWQESRFLDDNDERVLRVKTVIALLSRYIAVSKAISGGASSFAEKFLPYYLTPVQGFIIAPITKADNGDETGDGFHYALHTRGKVIDDTGTEVDGNITPDNIHFVIKSKHFDLVGEQRSFTTHVNQDVSNLRIINSDGKYVLPPLPDQVGAQKINMLPASINPNMQDALSYILYLPIKNLSAVKRILLDQAKITKPVETIVRKTFDMNAIYFDQLTDDERRAKIIEYVYEKYGVKIDPTDPNSTGKIISIGREDTVTASGQVNEQRAQGEYRHYPDWMADAVGYTTGNDYGGIRGDSAHRAKVLIVPAWRAWFGTNTSTVSTNLTLTEMKAITHQLYPQYPKSKIDINKTAANQHYKVYYNENLYETSYRWYDCVWPFSVTQYSYKDITVEFDSGTFQESTIENRQILFSKTQWNDFLRNLNQLSSELYRNNEAEYILYTEKPINYITEVDLRFMFANYFTLVINGMEFVLPAFNKDEETLAYQKILIQ